MATEIERKFLVINDSWRDAVESHVRVLQGYLSNGPNATVRVRVKGEAAFLTIKGRMQGISRSEYEYEIPLADAESMLRDLSVSSAIDKTRYHVRCGDHLWELDLFRGANAGLVMAEVELSSEDEAFEMPAWAGQEVSEDLRYYNVNLATNPYTSW
ncbi:MAG: CYTH domain-containing protein [Thiohalocapsa sp.]